MTVETKQDRLAHANVILKAIDSVRLNWIPKTINGAECIVSELVIPEITNTIISNDIIMVYVKHDSKNSWSALPLPFNDGENSFFLSYAIVAGKLILKSIAENRASPSTRMSFRLLILQGYTEKVANMNLLDYRATLDFLGINQDQPQEANS